MTRSEAIKALFFKSVLPVTVALILYCIFKSACMKNGEIDYVWLWILCGLPFGIWRLRLWIIPGGGSLGSGIALFALNFILAGIIGGFVLVWRLIVAAADGVEIDSWMTTLKTQTGGIIPSGFLIIPCPQKNHMHFLC